MFFNKKSALEEILKVSFSYSNKTPELETVRDLLYEPSMKVTISEQ